MNAHRFHWLLTILTLACFLVVAWSVPADAQKKKAKSTTTTTSTKETKEQPKDEAKEEQEEKSEKAEELTPTPTPSTVTLPNKFLDVIKQYVGKKTNLGTLKKIAGDYMIFEDDLTTILVPLNNIQSAKLVKDEETSPANLEIKLIAKD